MGRAFGNRLIPWRWGQRCSDERQMRDRRLQRVKAVIQRQRQRRMLAKSDDDRLFLDAQYRRMRVPWAGR